MEPATVEERKQDQRVERRLITRLLAALADMGVNTREVLLRAGAESPAQTLEHGWPTYAFWEAVAQVSGQSGMGVRLAEHMTPADFGLIGGLIANSGTLGEALLHALRLSRLALKKLQFASYSDGEHTSITIASAKASELHEEELGFVMALGVIAARSVTGRELELVQVTFPHPAPSDVRHHERVFRAPLRFGATHAGCTWPTGLLLAPLPRRDELLFSSLVEKAEQRLRDATSDFAQQVKAAILAELRNGDPSIKHAAARLRTYPHTVTRRLRALGLSYRELVNSTRFELATQYLQTSTVRMTTIASALGYSNKSAFIRAFSRRAGCSPVEYRKRVRSSRA